MGDLNPLSIDGDINLSRKILDELCLKYRFPRQKVQSVLVQRDIRLIHSITEPNWELAVLERYGIKHAIELRASKDVLSDMVMSFVTTAVEKYYQETVIYSTFSVVKIANVYQLFSITIFKNQISPKNSNIVPKGTEEQMASSFAKRIRELTGKGPQKCKAIVMSQKVIIYTLAGFFSDGDKQMASRSEVNIDYIEKIAQHNITEALLFLHQQGKSKICDIIPIFDIQKDMVTIIVLFN